MPGARRQQWKCESAQKTDGKTVAIRAIPKMFEFTGILFANKVGSGSATWSLARSVRRNEKQKRIVHFLCSPNIFRSNYFNSIWYFRIGSSGRRARWLYALHHTSKWFMRFIRHAIYVYIYVHNVYHVPISLPFDCQLLITIIYLADFLFPFILLLHHH